MRKLTHRAFGVNFAMLASMLVHHFGVESVQYYICAVIMILAAKYGAVFPDFDHDWRSVGDKTAPKWVINKLIHATGGRHRSRHTHSWDIAIVITVASYVVPQWLAKTGQLGIVDAELLRVVWFGACCGWISHLVADMLTTGGVYLSCICKKRVAIVPKVTAFSTGGSWEASVLKVIKGINFLVGVACLTYPIWHDGKFIEYIKI